MAFGCDPFPPNQFNSITLTGLTSGGPVSPDVNGNISLGGSNVAVVGDPTTNTLSFIAPSAAGITWIENESEFVQMMNNTGYIENFSGTATYMLPPTSNLGDVLYIVSNFETIDPLPVVWQIFLGPGQKIALGNSITTVGPTNNGPPMTGAFLAQNSATSVYLVCAVPNIKWDVISVQGSADLV